MNAKLLRPLALSASILILGAAGGTALAQNAPPPGPGAAREHHDWRGQHGDPAARAQRHAEHLRAALQLTPAQEPALAAYIAAAKPPEGMRGHRGDRQQMAALSTPERLDRAKVRMDEHRAMFERRAAATKRFYAQLSPSQQKAFDTLHAGHGGRGHDRHGPMGRG